MTQATITMRVDETLKKKFDSLCDQFGFSNTAAFTIFMKAVVRERRIPFEIKADNDDEIRIKGREAFYKLRAQAAANGIQDMSLDEINAIIKEVRDGR